MKKFQYFAFFLLCLLPLVGFSQELFVEVEDRGTFFQIKMRTYQDQNSMCQLKLASINIEKSTFARDGQIILQVIKDTHKRCQEAIGPYKGCFTLRKGLNLPEGRYSLIINEEDYGFLYIFPDEVYFDPINCL